MQNNEIQTCVKSQVKTFCQRFLEFHKKCYGDWVIYKLSSSVIMVLFQTILDTIFFFNQVNGNT